MMTGYWEKGILFDFDMNYFNNAGVDIDGFAPVFKQYYNRAFTGTNNYKPSAQLKRRKGSYGQWVQTSPSDGAWVNFAQVKSLLIDGKLLRAYCTKL